MDLVDLYVLLKFHGITFLTYYFFNATSFQFSISILHPHHCMTLINYLISLNLIFFVWQIKMVTEQARKTAVSIETVRQSASLRGWQKIILAKRSLQKCCCWLTLPQEFFPTQGTRFARVCSHTQSSLTGIHRVFVATSLGSGTTSRTSSPAVVWTHPALLCFCAVCSLPRGRCLPTY